jgi:hypothetical protein
MSSRTLTSDHVYVYIYITTSERVLNGKLFVKNMKRIGCSLYWSAILAFAWSHRRKMLHYEPEQLVSPCGRNTGTCYSCRWNMYTNNTGTSTDFVAGLRSHAVTYVVTLLANLLTLSLLFRWVAGIATRYRLDGPGIEFPVAARFSAPVQTGLEAHPASYTMGTESFLGVKRPRRGVDHPPHLAPRLKKEYICTSTPLLGIRGLF